MTILSFFYQYKAIILFYLVIALFLLWKRKEIASQAKIIFLYRTKLGLKLMDRWANKYRAMVILLGYMGAGVGFVGLFIISYVLVKNLYSLIIHPDISSGVSLVLPGVNIPGLGVLPFWYWLISIFVIAIVHEFSHGVVARAWNIPVKNTGLVFLGPIIGAFVEPDEKKLQKTDDIKQYSVLAAGAFSNILLGILALFLLNFIFVPLQQSMVEPVGFTFDSYYNESLPFAQAGILPGTIITSINGEAVSDFTKFNERFSCLAPGDKVILETKGSNDQDNKKANMLSTNLAQSESKEVAVILAVNPTTPDKPFLGIKEIRNEYKIKEKYNAGWFKAAYVLIDWFAGFWKWLFLLSIGICIFNLLPLPIVDGGRMAQVALKSVKGEEKGEKRYRQLSAFFLLILLLNLIGPFVIKLLW